MLPPSPKDGPFGPHPVRETAAGSLLVIGRLAIAEFCKKRGQDSALLEQLHGEVVASWVATWGCDPMVVEEVVSNIYASLCDGYVSFDTTQPAPLVVSQTSLCRRH